ncbi:hypothetical protein [Burkholderia pseudomallei]|uniref:hypothetical protein n=1 Tax=Burkholderia pseudomallei TaxID=28450 RepID=UPI00050F553F|nr:hypothetical protein [Burkholderia pseudomallei]KGC58866.1 hypothetical protein DP56_1347 [Burkholderia pseudomallei]
MPTASPIAWNDPTTAVAALTPLLGPDGALNNVLVRLDPSCVHFQQGPKYRLSRFALDANGQAHWVWVDATGTTAGLPLYGISGWALAE